MADVLIAPTPAKTVVRTRMPIRKWVALAHLWVGLPVGLFVSLFTLAGALIVFSDQIERVFEPKAAAPCTTPVDLDAALQQAVSMAGGAKITQITVPSTSGENFHFSGRNIRVVHSGCAALGMVQYPVMNWLTDFHKNLFSGKTGRTLTGIIAMVLLCLIGTGLTIWLLSNPNLKTAFAVSGKGPARRLVWELHRATGLGVMVFLTISSVTGISLAYPDTVRQGLDWVMGVKAEPKPDRAKRGGKKPQDDGGGGPELHLRPLADYAGVVASAIAGGEIREIRLPEGGSSRAIALRVWAPGDFRGTGGNRVTVDAETLKVASISRFADAAASLKITQGATALHYAEWGGWPVRAIWLMAGLMPSVLFVSGGLIWWLRRKPRARTTL